MANTQLSCPHCGSMLTFGTELAAGTPVECLICMGTFAAEPTALETAPPSPMPKGVKASAAKSSAGTLSDKAVTMEMPAAAAPKAAKAKAASKDGVAVAKPFSAPPSGVTTGKPAPTAEDANPDAPVRLRRPTKAGAGNKGLLVVAAFGLLVLLAGGIGLAAWKITQSARHGPAEDLDSGPIASQSNPSNQEPDPDGPEGNTQNKNDAQAPLSEEDEEDIRFKLQEEVKQLLKRKITLKPGGAPEWDPVATFNVGKQTATGLDQQKINAAIERGIAYLKRTQKADGTWHVGHAVGQASIGGLTLLECGVPANDSHVQRSAFYVRTHLDKLQATYELSLAILFLDRLGDKRDRPLIQGMALRLLAGQNHSGGWSYQCPLLTPQEMYQLLTFLHANKRPDLLDPLGVNSKTQTGIVVNPNTDRGKLNDPFNQLNDLINTKGFDAPETNGKSSPNPPKESGIRPVSGNPKPPKKGAAKPIRAEWLNPNLQRLPIVQNQGKRKNQIQAPRGGGDNSNTQFALLAMWTARRHNVPTDHALVAASQRFVQAQGRDGGWGYHSENPNTIASTPSMTGVGLLGLAMGHGAAPEIINFNPKNPKDAVIKPALQDPVIQRGLQAFARGIGQPFTKPDAANFPMQNLYFLWTVERVAMLYDLKTIGGKDWYGWGAQILVHNQGPQGDWANSHYPGANAPVNTCFALLFLRRSNLVQDLTNNLRLYSGIREGE